MHQKLNTPAEALLALQQGEGLEYFFNTYFTRLTYFANSLVEDGLPPFKTCSLPWPRWCSFITWRTKA